MNVMEKIKSVREARNITQKELGSVLGVAKETYRNIENGRIRLKLDDYLLICRFLGLAPSYFLSDYDENYTFVSKKDLHDIFALASKVSSLKKKLSPPEQTSDNELNLYMSDSAKDEE